MSGPGRFDTQVHQTIERPGHFNRRLLDGFAWIPRGATSTSSRRRPRPFDIPEHLADRWNIRTAGRVAP